MCVFCIIPFVTMDDNGSDDGMIDVMVNMRDTSIAIDELTGHRGNDVFVNDTEDDNGTLMIC